MNYIFSYLATIPAPLMDFDLGSLVKNAKKYAEMIGGGLMGLIGVILVIVAVVHAANKLMAEDSRQKWLRIILTLLIGGALLGGGWALVVNVANGGNKTITDLGNGGGVIAPMIDYARIMIGRF